MPAGTQQLPTDLDGFRKRARCVFQRREHQIAQRMVAREIETVLERLGKRVVRVGGKGRQALADIPRRGHMRLFTQNAGGSAIVCHGNDRRCAHAHGQKRADGHRRAGAAADHHRLELRRIDRALQWVRKMKRPNGLKRLRGGSVEPEAMPRQTGASLTHFSTSLFVSASAMSRW